MEALEVFVTKEGHVAIAQESAIDDTEVVRVSPHQIDVLISWLQEAKAEALRVLEGLEADDR